MTFASIRPHLTSGLYLSLFVCAAFVVAGVFAPLLVPVDPNLQSLGDRLLPPLTQGHLLGTDGLGRDVLARLIAGARVPLLVSVSAVTISAVIGVMVGLVGGYVGGLLDTVLMRITDAWLAFPFILLAIAFVGILGPGLGNVIIALVASQWAIYVRLVRGQVLSLREREFVLSTRALGVSHVRIALQHILPAALSPILIVATLEVGSVIVAEASLSFLGMGVSASQPTWGSMLSEGRAYLSSAWWLATLPGVIIFLIVLAVNFIGNAVRDLLDPRTSRQILG